MATPISSTDASQKDYRLRWVDTIPFWGVHVAAVVGLIVTGWSWAGFGLALGMYFLRMFAITGGYHRYFSHRSYKTSRWFQLVLAVLGATATQKGVLWWSAHHRRHHKYSDQEGDVHSAKLEGFVWSHMTWILVNKWEHTEWDRIPDLAKYPELRFVDKWATVIAALFATLLFVLGGWHALFWGYFFSTVLLWHGTFCINSVTHMWGRKRYDSGDESRNSFLLAIICMGEGWHNNHHYYQRSTPQGFFWWEIDLTYYILRLMSCYGLVWDLHRAPKHVRDNPKKLLKHRESSQDRAPVASIEAARAATKHTGPTDRAEKPAA